MLIEQAFDKHFVMIPLRIDHPLIYLVCILKYFIYN